MNEPKTPFSMDDLPRILGNISKMYQTEDKKYNGWNDSLDYKMDMYKDICDINQCPLDRRMDGLILALKEPALGEFRAHRHDVGMTFDGMINHFRGCYEGIDFKRSELQAWHTISYKLNKEQNQKRPPSGCVVILVDALNAKRRSLDLSQRTDDAMHTRLTNACWGIPEFQSALSDPSSHLPTFINQLKMAVKEVKVDLSNWQSMDQSKLDKMSEWVTGNTKAANSIMYNCETTPQLVITNYQTSAEMWRALEQAYEGTGIVVQHQELIRFVTFLPKALTKNEPHILVKDRWLADSGADTMITNQFSDFLEYTVDQLEIQGAGGITLSPGVGTVQLNVALTNGTMRQINLSNVRYLL
ncbi:hypothetical protein EV44_g3186 [Erysiphe necator]|uniref:Uncharacterized protein n=1 Tax=Uncinula necator TaxID=52586 RepID=A0A0B1NUJ1_UNCNE|nr:hypothetical protein EV44_g3186 [Erysiphe necator]